MLENNLGRLLHKLGEFDEAIGHYGRSLALSEKQSNKLRRAVTYGNLAGVHGDKKEWAAAIDWFEKAIAIHSQANNLSSPDAIITRTSLANIQRRAGDTAAAIETIVAAHESAQHTLGEEHFITAYAQNVAALAYCDSGNWQQGLDYARRSLATRENILPPGHWLLPSSRSVLGECETRAGNFAVAQALLTEAYQKLVELRGEQGTQTLIVKERLEALERARAANQ